jgi:uncharacterized protein YegJ (DUF2314 family)
MQLWSRLCPLILALAVTLGGCGNETNNFVQVAEDDAEMNAATAKARETVDQFIAALANPPSDAEGFAVKAGITDGETVEHMWLTDPVYRDGAFTGTINNEPQRVTNVTFGQSYSVAREEISDWNYMRNGKLVGGYTVRVFVSRMPDDQREAMEAMLGLD